MALSFFPNSTSLENPFFIHRFPGRFGLENPCFCSCLGRNSSSIIDPVISDGLEASNCVPQFSISNGLYRETSFLSKALFCPRCRKGRGEGHLLCKFKAQVILCSSNYPELGGSVDHSFSNLRSWRTGIDED